MRKFFLVVGVVLLLSTYRLCVAQTSKSLLAEDFKWTNLAQRVNVAIELRTSLEKLRKLIPAPTPAEIDWIQREQMEADQYSERWLRVVSSREALQDRLKSQLDWLDSMLEELSKAHSQEAEMLLWCNVCLQIQAMSTHFNDALKALMRADYLPKNLRPVTDLVPIGDDYTLVLNSAGQKIQSKILLAYFVTRQSEIKVVKVIY